MHDIPDITQTDPLLRQEAVAEYIDVSMATLEKWRKTGRGPAHIRVGRLVRYRQSDLDRWLRQQTVGGEAA
ncbi:MAG TPA: helix-turn-helix domain-containing protein [Gammaproteobacteria bacterium]